MFGLRLLSTNNKTEKLLFAYLWVISPFFLNDVVNFFSEKRIHNTCTFQIRGEKTQRQQIL